MAFPLVPILTAAVPTLIDAIADLFPDTKSKASAEAKLTAAIAEYGHQQAQAQMEVNKVEAAHVSTFVAGWRPALMWICASCIFYTWWVYPWMIFFAAIHWPEYVDKIPQPPNDELWVLVFGAMGLGGMRTFEKVKGVAKGKG